LIINGRKSARVLNNVLNSDWSVVMTDKGYYLAWLVYLACSIGLLFCFWYITHTLYDWVREPLRASAAVFLLMPWTAANGMPDMAPAWLTALFDGLLQQDASLSRAGIPLLCGLLVGLLLAVLSLRQQRRRAV
jgi:hypothetical protein